MKLNDSRVDVRIVKATLEEADWKALLIEAVAKHAGIALGPRVAVRAFLSTRDTSTGHRHDICVELTEDYAGADRPIE